MNANVTWHQGMSFSGTAGGGIKIPLTSGSEEGAADASFQPLELMAVSLAGCTAMDVLSILKKKQQVVTAFEVLVRADQADEHPKVFTHALITYLVSGRAVEESALLRAIELSATKYCPAQAMLGKVMPIELAYEIYEDTGEAGSHLVKKGNYPPRAA